MKNILLLLTCLFCHFSCKEANTQIQTNIHYKQKVNGYDVSVICHIDRRHNGISYNNENPEAISGRGFIHFKNEEKEIVIENPLFTDCNLFNNELLLEDGMTIEVDYTPFLVENPQQPFISNKSPFFFYDIDFDETEELVVCLWEGMGYRGHHTYQAYKLNVGCGSHQLSPMQGAPFNELNDYTEFDPIHKTISVPYGVGLKMEGEKVYGLVDDSFMLIERVQYDWEHTKGMKYELCEPTIYHYMIVDGKEILDKIERCPNDKQE